MGTAKKSEFSEQQMAHLFSKKKPKTWKVRQKKDIIYGQREKDISHFENPKKHPPPPQKKCVHVPKKNQKKSKK